MLFYGNLAEIRHLSVSNQEAGTAHQLHFPSGMFAPIPYKDALTLDPVIHIEG